MLPKAVLPRVGISSIFLLIIDDWIKINNEYGVLLRQENCMFLNFSNYLSERTDLLYWLFNSSWRYIIIIQKIFKSLLQFGQLLLLL